MGFIYTDSRFKKKIIDQSVSLARKKRETFFLNQTLEPAFFLLSIYNQCYICINSVLMPHTNQ